MIIARIALRDLSAYLSGYAGYSIISAILLITGLLFNFFVLGGDATYSHKIIENFFYLASGVAMFSGILVTMPSLAEERDNGTDVLLRTSAVSDGQVVLGKYIGAMAVVLLIIALTAYMPLLVMVNGKVSIAHIGVGYLGVALLGSAVCAIGIFSSSLFRTQLPAGVIGAVITITLLLGWLGSQVTDPPFTEVLAYTALFDKHFQPFQEGRLRSTGVVFYTSLTFVFLMLATRVLQSRRHE